MCSELYLFDKELINGRSEACLYGGIDEAGRGPLAGPVVSSCVILRNDPILGINDSKKLSEKKRKGLYLQIKKKAYAVGIGIVSVEEIDEINILNASKLSMVKAINNTFPAPSFVLVDGKDKLDISIEQQSIIKGDTKSASIAAASIVAKVTRDEIMSDLNRRFPLYRFHTHKGYPTRDHRELIKKYGPSPYHRKTFKGVKEYIS